MRKESRTQNKRRKHSDVVQKVQRGSHVPCSLFKACSLRITVVFTRTKVAEIVECAAVPTKIDNCASQQISLEKVRMVSDCLTSYTEMMCNYDELTFIIFYIYEKNTVFNDIISQ